MTSNGDHADTALDPTESLALITDQQRRTETAIEPNVALIYGVWGAALLLGEGAFFLATWTDSPWMISTFVAGITLFVLLVTAGVTMGIHIARRVGGVRGVSSRQGAYYGWSWMLGFAAMAMINAGVARVTGDEALVGTLWASGSALIIGLLYMAGGAIWLDRSQFFLGALFVVVAGVGGLLGSPWAFLVLSTAGGGGMLVVSALSLLRQRKGAR